MHLILMSFFWHFLISLNLLAQLLGSELESIRTLFNEKEKELSVALTKVDALTRQLEELRKGNTSNSYHINGISNAKHGIELEKLRQELLVSPLFFPFVFPFSSTYGPTFSLNFKIKLLM